MEKQIGIQPILSYLTQYVQSSWCFITLNLTNQEKRGGESVSTMLHEQFVLASWQLEENKSIPSPSRSLPPIGILFWCVKQMTGNGMTGGWEGDMESRTIREQMMTSSTIHVYTHTRPFCFFGGLPSRPSNFTVLKASLFSPQVLQ